MTPERPAVSSVLPRMSQVERSERSTAALLEAAADLILESGFASVTLAAIGERAGFSRGLVTSRFGSKDGLIEALVDRIVSRWGHHNVLPRTEGKPGLDGVLVLLDAIRAQGERDSRGIQVLYTLMFEAAAPETALRETFAVFHEDMRMDIAQLIRRGIRDGSVRRGLNAKREAALIVGGLRGIGYQWLLDRQHFDLVEHLSYLCSTTRARLGAPSMEEQ
jgi:AcrR family transcriptional regulator